MEKEICRHIWRAKKDFRMYPHSFRRGPEFQFFFRPNSILRKLVSLLAIWALTVDSVSVDLQRANAQFNLWGSFTIPAGASAVLTQTQLGNFDTSAFSIVACGRPLAAGETRIPRITVTIAGTPQTFLDTSHVLDTGGFDLSCRGNESLQWRQVGASGIES